MTTWWRNRGHKSENSVFRKNLFCLSTTARFFILYSERSRRDLQFEPKITPIDGGKWKLWHFCKFWHRANQNSRFKWPKKCSYVDEKVLFIRIS